MAGAGGHLFLVRGDLTRLAVDAVLVPSGWANGRLGHVANEAWDRLLGGALDEQRMVTPAPTEADRVCEVRRLAGGPAVWCAHTGESGQKPEWYADAARLFVELAGAAGSVLEKRPLDHDRPLLALPLLGVGLGGGSHRKGEVVIAFVQQILVAMERVDADVVLVLADDAAFAAAQQARRRVLGDAGWRGLEAHVEVAGDLARRARARQLVLFVGSGASIGAGGRTWKGLLEALGRRAAFDRTQMEELTEHLDTRDAGQVLSKELTSERLRADVVKLTTIERPALVHQLLASLPVDQVVTTNCDEGLEFAFEAAGRPLAVLPKRWIGASRSTAVEDMTPVWRTGFRTPTRRSTPPRGPRRPRRPDIHPSRATASDAGSRTRRHGRGRPP